MKLLTKAQWNVCVCPTCFNIKYKPSYLNRAFPNNKSPRNEKELVKYLMCGKPDVIRFHHSNCEYGICEKCSSHRKTLVQHYHVLSQGQLRNLSWNHWERKMGFDGKIRKCMVKKRRKCTTMSRGIAGRC